jgi:2-succinyl-5-enolpyruvyl-6-hydroxy-3-cyclohexene-1-carboxylate synthase
VTRDATTSFARTLVDEWARAGVTDAVLAPGSRSAPLALALAADDRITVHVHVDERAAGGFALGLARGSGRPAVLVCTSGTAAALYHAAVLEAHHGGVPLVVCTADRPPELHDVGAGQTIEQRGLYGEALRWSADPGPPDDRPGVGAVWRGIAARAVDEAVGPPAGPVHLNLAFREPLVPTGAPLVDAPGRADGAPWITTHRHRPAPDSATVDALAGLVRRHPRGVVVAGADAGIEPPVVARFADAAGWPVLADPLSGLRVGRHAVSTYDAVARSDLAGRLRPDAVLRLGAPPTSKALAGWLPTDVPTWLVDPSERWSDPARAASTRSQCDPGLLLSAVVEVLGDHPEAEADWPDRWCDAERRARNALDAVCDASDEPFEGRVARDLVAAVPSGATVVVASSMPVRDVESFAAPREGVDFIANRGVNGIDGFVSTALGVAAARRGAPVVALVGDLCFLHDANALVRVTERGLDTVFVVVDNDGGGIFSFLPQASAGTVPAEAFELLFGTPHGVDLAELAAVHGVPCTDCDRASNVPGAVCDAIAAGGVRMVRVRTDRGTNVVQHRAAWDAVAEALDL